MNDLIMRGQLVMPRENQVEHPWKIQANTFPHQCVIKENNQQILKEKRKRNVGNVETNSS